jgi:hypothetical protein
MRLRERQNEEARQQPAAGVPASQGSQNLREAAERLLAQGADAIDRALSGNSAAFLAANRQEGGQ